MKIFSFDLGEVNLAYVGVEFNPITRTVLDVPYANNVDLNDYINRCVRCSAKATFINPETHDNFCVRHSHIQHNKQLLYCKLNKIPDIEIRIWNFLDTIKHLFYEIGFEYTIYEAPYRNVEWQKHLERAINTWFYINKIPTKLHVFDARRKMKYLPLNTELIEHRRYKKTKEDTKQFVFKHLTDHNNHDLVEYFKEYQLVNEVRNTDMIDAIFNAYIFVREK